MSNRLLLDASGITKKFSGVPALKNGTLKLRAGSVHALCGGNGAGKSTLLNILMGIIRCDEGRIKINEKEVRFNCPKDALKSGISMISQELEPVPYLTVAENIFLGRETKTAGFIVKSSDIVKKTQRILNELHINISPTARLGDLSISEIQMIEIAKAISQNAQILIMDEPTSAIGERETDLLFEAIKKIKLRGTSIVYVSHRMNEIFRISDEYTVMRDGSFVESGSIKNTNRKKLIDTILGKELLEEYSKFNKIGKNEILKINNYTRKGEFSEINFSLKEGEILGIFGLMGSGRSEFLDALFGITHPQTGEAHVNGVKTLLKDPKSSINAGLAYVTEDRKGSGLSVESSIRENISITSMKMISRLGIVSSKKEEEITRKCIDEYQIKTSSLDMKVRNMSGGNQQKVVLAKWGQTSPKILILDEPTRGIDVGAKREVYRFMSEFSCNKRGIIMSSSEIPEILGMCDRVIVFRRGKVSGELHGEDLTQDNLAKLAS